MNHPAGFLPDAALADGGPAKPRSCHFFLARKRRYCNIPATHGSLWCGNHRPNEEDAAAAAAQQDGGQRAEPAVRVPCPVDPAHTIYAHNLQSHVKVCTKARDNEQWAAQPFYRANINSTTSAAAAAAASRATPSMPTDDIPALFARAQALALERHARLFPPPSGSDAVQQLTTGEPATAIISQVARVDRHALQQASLVSHLHRRGLLDGATTVVELGAGRGSLGLAVKLAFPSASLVMVERSGVKLKADKRMRQLGSTDFRRLRMDLRHLFMQGLGLPVDSRLAFIGKHACGVATDLGLRAVATYLSGEASDQQQQQQQQEQQQPVGLGIACCCYHVCLWDDYVGREVWEEELGWGRREFGVLKKTACWVASCQGEWNRQAKGEKGEGRRAAEHELPEEEPAGADTGGYGRGLSAEEKLAIGTAAKRLIDLGRLEFLRRAGLEGELVTYCEPAVSPENTCIMAWTKETTTNEKEGE